MSGIASIHAQKRGAAIIVCLVTTLWTLGCGDRKAVVEEPAAVGSEPKVALAAPPIEESIAPAREASFGEAVDVTATRIEPETTAPETTERVGDSATPLAVAAPVEEARPTAELSADGIPDAPMGQPRVPSVLASMPGYQAADDPEAASVETGRREVGPIEFELSGGEASAEELVIVALEAIRQNDLAQLRELGVTQTEFEKLCWPEFPESRPATGWSAHDAWGNFDSRNISGTQRGISDWGGKGLFLEEISYRSGRAPYTNFTLYRDAVLQVRAEDGEIVELDFIRTLIERNGRWKIYSFKD